MRLVHAVLSFFPSYYYFSIIYFQMDLVCVCVCALSSHTKLELEARQCALFTIACSACLTLWSCMCVFCFFLSTPCVVISVAVNGLEVRQHIHQRVVYGYESMVNEYHY